MGKEADEIARGLLSQALGSDWEGIGEEEVTTDQPIQGLVFSDQGIRLLADIHEGSFGVLIGMVENGSAIVSHIAEIAYRRDMVAAFEEARGMVQVNDPSISIIGLYAPRDNAQSLAGFLQPPGGLDFVMSGFIDGAGEFCVDPITRDAQGQLLPIPSVRVIEVPRE